MKHILMSMAAVTALAIGAPAMAQSGGYAQANADIGSRILQLRTRIQTGVQQGTISRQEAQSLRIELRALSRLERSYSRDGLSGQERADLQQRMRTLRRQIRVAEGGRGMGRDFDDDDGYRDSDRVDNNRDGWDDRDTDRDGRWDDNANDRIDNNRDGWDDRDTDRDGRWDDNVDDRIDNNRDGWDDRDTDRDGRWDDNVDDGRYENDNRPGGVIGQVLDSVLGGGGLRVGQRVSGNLYAVPSEYRDQYRDGGGVYYRADQRRIYQIDARTHTVLRVYAMSR